MMQPPPPQQQQWAMAPPPPPPQYFQAGHPPPPPPQFYQAGPPPPAMWGQPPPQAAPAPAPSGGGGGDDARTLWIGDLQYWMDENYLYSCFSQAGEVISVKIIRNKQTGQPEGYGFIEFGNHALAEQVLQNYNGQMMPNVSYSSFHSSAATYQNTQGTDSDNDPSNTTVFVGGLDPSVTDELLRQTFSPYGELLYVKIPVGKRCGFVQYSNRASAEEAIRVLNGSQLGGQNIRLSWGRSPANKQPQQEQNQWSGGYYGYPQGYDPYGYARPPQDPAIKNNDSKGPSFANW
nr:unnamed protein product [Digitaria exilis]CAB3499091.1 unnamed protein product [Digitaria exilis]